MKINAMLFQMLNIYKDVKADLKKVRLFIYLNAIVKVFIQLFSKISYKKKKTYMKILQKLNRIILEL